MKNIYRNDNKTPASSKGHCTCQHCASMFYLILTIIFICAGKSTEKSTLKNETTHMNFSNKSVVSETQHTICSIKTEEVVAKAQSTASTILTGICTTEEMTRAFENMERKFAKQLEEFQRNLTTMIQAKFQSSAQKKIYRSSKLSPIKAVDYILDENIFKNYT